MIFQMIKKAENDADFEEDESKIPNKEPEKVYPSKKHNFFLNFNFNGNSRTESLSFSFKLKGKKLRKNHNFFLFFSLTKIEKNSRFP